VVVICPKCKIKLKVDDAKISSSGSRFKCPKCSTVLIVRKPPVQAPQTTLDSSKVLLAHSNAETLESTRALLVEQGYKVITSADGIDVMVKALKELPFLAVVEVSLPKIYGFEICKKLKARAETKDMKFILIPSIYDKSKYRREPTSLYGADDYIEAQDIPASLIPKINKLMAVPEEGAEKPQTGKMGAAPSPQPPAGAEAEAPGLKPEARVASTPVAAAPGTATASADEKTDEAVEKARRLSRTIINDIFLYNSAKVMEAIKNGTFYNVFAAELGEGKKLYENRIPLAIRERANYYKETIEEFVARKKNEAV
jgi:predicted Zn finger-like uncharacterized protein